MLPTGPSERPSPAPGTGASFKTILNSETGCLELDLAITTAFVVVTDCELRLPDLQPMPGLWSNATAAVPTTSFTIPSSVQPTPFPNGTGHTPSTPAQHCRDTVWRRT